MARFNYETADNYGGQANGSFFQLRDDGDVARVRFMYATMEDMEGLAVHEITINDKKRYVNCLRDYNDPIDACPFCKAKMKVVPKIFIPLIDVDTNEVKIWERGKSYFKKFSGLFARYSPLCSHTFDVERHGKHGDMKTDYQIFETGNDKTAYEDLPEQPKVLGGLVLDKNADEMNYYLDYGVFPGDPEDTQQNGGRQMSRSDSRDSRNDARNDSQPVRRRVPSRGSEDVY